MLSEKLLNYFNGNEFAAGVWVDKYQMKEVDGTPLEETPDDMHKRMATEFARIEKAYDLKGLIPDELSAFGRNLYGNTGPYLDTTTIYNYFKDFRFIIPQGSIMSMLGHKYKVGSLSNCFVVPAPFDSYGGILHTDQHLVQLMKRRGGVGTNLNKLRHTEAAVYNAAESSTGVPSFAGRYSNTSREVAQDGRRGALMLMLSCMHPDIFNFVKMKDDRTKVTGANVTSMLTDEFMEAAQADEDFICRFPVDAYVPEGTIAYEDLPYNTIVDLKYSGLKAVMKIHARELFDLIIEMAWKNGEPGLAFMDRVHSYSPDGVYEIFKAIASNPCGEQWLPPYDSCRLIVINLFSIIVNPFTANAYIDYEKLYEISYMQQRLADNLVDLEVEHVERIINKIYNDPEPFHIKQDELELWQNVLKVAKAGRRTGCGFTGMADTLAALGYKYDSNAAMEVITEIAKTKMRAELDCTVDLAITRGTFEGWDLDKEFSFAPGIGWFGQNDFYEMLLLEFPKEADRMRIHGRRNVSWSNISPTGTLSILGKLVDNFNESAAIEPAFDCWFFRNRKINPSDKNVRVDFVDQNGDAWQQTPVVMGAFKDWYNISGYKEEIGTEIEDLKEEDLKQLLDLSPWAGATANLIDWSRRVQIQSIIQRYTTNAISSTINLPNDIDKETVANIYWEAWKAGLKGITVYRDGCRTGVLVKTAITADEFTQYQAPKRPERLPASIFHLKVKGVDYTVAVGELNGKPYEVFATEGIALKGCERGEIRKKGKGRYHFVCNEIDEAITEEMSDEQATITRLLSTALRHGADIQFIVEQLNKTHGDLTSFSKALARTLKRYIPEGANVKIKCDNCGEPSIIMEEGCMKCKSCGTSKCG